MWAKKLTESANISYISDGVARTIKVNIKEVFMGNDAFRKMFNYVNGLNLENKRPITWEIYYLVREWRIPKCEPFDS